ncbi:MAG TPA: Gfo/Idh/MocA family oxidoreductase [Phycisphaerae bacterium]|nr:Gfo/Idh/MocA family oxidoreductase [Phycisphaerae bacterium]
MMKVGLMGLGRGGQIVAEALLSSSWCQLAAVASRKSHRIDRFVERHPEITAYDDFRSLIVENPLDALFVAVPPFLRGKYLTLAAEHRCPVWMLSPAARRFDESVEIMERFEKARCPIVVSRSWGMEPSLQPDAVGLDRLGRFFLAVGGVYLCTGEDLDWRGDSVRAGGGVLLDRGYELLDTVVKVMGLPATVYAAAKGVSRPGTRFPYDTEDTAALICQFSGGAVAAVTACWTSGPERCEIEFFGTGGTLRIDSRCVLCRDRAGERTLAELPRAANPLLASVEDFLSSLKSKSEHFRSSIRDHLATMAVIQAAYLSARTGQPESPGAILRMHDVNPRIVHRDAGE